MPTPSQNQNARIESRVETQEQRLDILTSRINKYDEIIDELRVIVIALKTTADVNRRWIAVIFTLGATVTGAGVGAGITVLLTHLIH